MAGPSPSQADSPLLGTSPVASSLGTLLGSSPLNASGSFMQREQSSHAQMHSRLPGSQERNGVMFPRSLVESVASSGLGRSSLDVQCARGGDDISGMAAAGAGAGASDDNMFGYAP
jgi:hypothetical protein